MEGQKTKLSIKKRITTQLSKASLNVGNRSELSLNRTYDTTDDANHTPLVNLINLFSQYSKKD